MLQEEKNTIQEGNICMFIFKEKGSFDRSEDFLKKIVKCEYINTSVLEKYGRKGVEALSSATPKKTGLTASSWNYKILKKKGTYELLWYNTNIKKGVPIAIILNYGHSTSDGSYVVGRNYIQPAIQPIFDELANEIWREVHIG